MKKACLLTPSLNKCKYFTEEGTCTATTSTCGMQVELHEQKKKDTEYVRSPRWYEKYYEPKRSF